MIVNTNNCPSTRSGVAYGLAAYGIWGFVLPLYFRLLGDVSPVELLAHRVVWSVALLLALVAGLGRWSELVNALRRPVLVGALAASAALIAGNWFVYIYAVVSDQMLQASLGYYVSPLLNVTFGVLFLRERLRPLQGLAVALAALGVGYLVITVGTFPWIALALAGSFAGYALIRKRTPVDGVLDVSIETLLMSPLAIGVLCVFVWQGKAAYTQGTGRAALLMVSGALTALPLLCFGQASRRLPLATLGFLQFVTPSLQFVLAVAIFREHLSAAQATTFGFIWVGLLLFGIDGTRSAARGDRIASGAPHLPRSEPAPALVHSTRSGG